MKEEQPEAAPTWQFNSETTAPSPEAAPLPQTLQPVEWTASEYIAHHKTPGWFVLLGLGVAGLSALVYLVTGGDKVSATVIAVAGIIFGVFGARRPRVLAYQVSSAGVQIGEKLYSYGELKSFALLDEGAMNSILLLPLKRLMPSISIYYAPEDEAKILEVLSACLPVEQRQQDPLERLMHRLRF